MKAIRNLVAGAQAFGLATSTALTVEVVPDGDRSASFTPSLERTARRQQYFAQRS
jgi:hypothetical protein